MIASAPLISQARSRAVLIAAISLVYGVSHEVQTSEACLKPSAIEWRTEAPDHPKDGGETLLNVADKPVSDRVAVCLLGVARFIDKTVILMERNLFNQLGMPYDIYAFASVGQHPSTCELFMARNASWSLGALLRGLFLNSFNSSNVALDDHRIDRPSVNASSLSEEYEALATFLDRSVSGRVVWDDLPLDLLESSTWQKMTRRPGPWLGGASNGRKMRPGAGLAQLRALQWCADAVHWQEKNVIGHAYTYVVFSRWDLQYLIPLPSLPLLRSMNPDAVWFPVALDDFSANDRFGVIPRKFVNAYFGGWRLLITGEVEQLFETIRPRSGLPVYSAEATNCEKFLHARLMYAGAEVLGLPTTAYVHCDPTVHWFNLRTRGHYSCTSFSALIQDIAGHAAAYGGSKYPREFYSIMVTDNALQNRYSYELKGNDYGLEEHDWSKRFKRLFDQQGDAISWNERLVNQARFIGSQFEVDRTLKEGWSCRSVNTTKQNLYHCENLLRTILNLAQTRTEYYHNALEIARNMVLAEPLHLERWIWLIVILLHPYLDAKHAAAAALVEAKALNASHRAIFGLGSLLQRNFPIRKNTALADALGSVNATWELKRNRAEAKRELKIRREMQLSCARHNAGSHAGLMAWLDFGNHLLKSKWIFAACGVFMHLEAEYLADGRPEALRARADAVESVRAFETKLRNVVEEPEGWGIWGASLEDYRMHAPSANELTDVGWLEKFEAMTSDGGRDRKASSVHNVVFAYSPFWKTYIPTGIV